MASKRLIRRRIRSAKNITQITRAMQLVAASKMKKAQTLALSGRPYAQKILEMTREFATRTERERHPLLKKIMLEKKLVVLISTNKGLCGALNANLFRAVLEWFGKEDVGYITLGKKGEGFVIRTGRELIADFSKNPPFIKNVSAITNLVMENYLEGIFGQVFLVYNNFISAFSQIPTKEKILPIELEESWKEEEKNTQDAIGEFLIEPNKEAVLEALLPHYLEVQIRAAILEAEACEHSARMLAMKNATDNAIELTRQLTLDYNRARQQTITYEIADMVTARMAVEK